MPNVEMKVQTCRQHHGGLQRLWPGMVVQVDTAVADQWEELGLAVPTKKAVSDPALADRFAEKSETRQEVHRTDLRIASLHGDVRAARQLDAMEMAAGTPGDPPRDRNVEGTPPPLTEAAETDKADHVRPQRATTGESARGALGGGGSK